LENIELNLRINILKNIAGIDSFVVHSVGIRQCRTFEVAKVVLNKKGP
jgi:hypothetical protein